jgi:hypothetical protein
MLFQFREIAFLVREGDQAMPLLSTMSLKEHTNLETLHHAPCQEPAPS